MTPWLPTSDAMVDGLREPYRDPLVEGMIPAARGSGSAAMRSARANALNTVSHW